METRQAASEVFVGERTGVELTGQEALSERRVRDDGDPELAARVEEVDLGRLDVRAERDVLDLQRGDGVHGVRAAQRVLGHLGV